MVFESLKTWIAQFLPGMTLHSNRKRPILVQLFNDALLRSTAVQRESLQLTLPAKDGAWAPNKIDLDIENDQCIGALVYYSKTGTIENLRRGLNRKYKNWESKSFINDPEMKCWRIENRGFTIQLSEDSDHFLAIYVLWVSNETIAQKIRELEKTEPELVAGFRDSLEDCYYIDPPT